MTMEIKDIYYSPDATSEEKLILLEKKLRVEMWLEVAMRCMASSLIDNESIRAREAFKSADAFIIEYDSRVSNEK